MFFLKPLKKIVLCYSYKILPGLPKENTFNRIIGGHNVDHLKKDEKTRNLLGGLNRMEQAFPWMVRLEGKCGGSIKGKRLGIGGEARKVVTNVTMFFY